MRAGRIAAACAVAVVAQLCLTSGASANTFTADPGSLGAIPDGAGTGPAQYGSARNIAIPVSGFSAANPTDVAVSMSIAHDFVGDLEVVLIAPDDSTQKTLFSRTGAAGAGNFGDSSNLAGSYTFADRAPTSPTWWDAAAALPGSDQAIPGDSYRASTPGGGGGGGAATTITPAFSSPDPNGTWHLRVRDGAAGDTGSVTAASLRVVGEVAPNGGTLGAIPDGTDVAPASFGPPRNVTFDVSGLPLVAPNGVFVQMAFSPVHDFAGDLDVTLIAPDGTTTATIFSRTGATGGDGFGDNSNLAGPYRFFDNVFGDTNWWATAASAGPTDSIPAANYRTSSPGPNGGTNTSLTGAFAGVANPNGTWTLRFRDGTAGATTSVTLPTSLQLVGGPDATPPAAPTFTGTDPASPSNSSAPKIKGTAEAGSTVRLFPSVDCTGLFVVAGSAADFSSPGIPFPVDSDGSHQISAKTYDTSGNVSDCTAAPIEYRRDTVAPLTPTFSETDPPSPANENFPNLKGSGAEAGSTIKVFDGPDCSGPQLFDGTAAAFNGAGVEIEVADDTSDPYRVNATDAAGNVSGCSGAITYTEDSTALPPSLTSTDPASPSSDLEPMIKGGAETGSDVDLYGSSNCSGPIAATGTAAALAGAGIEVEALANTTANFTAKITDLAGNVSTCSTPISYQHDSIAPLAPTLSATDPLSPANDDSPRFKGSAEAGSTVRLYMTSGCTGPPAATGTAAELAGVGIEVSVLEDATNTLRATATDAAGNVSACSAPLQYVEDSTALPPSLTATDPASPANENSPKVKGSAEAGSAVTLFKTSDCSGAPAATGTAPELAGPGIAVSVLDDSITEIRGVASDPAGNVSACSAPISYTESTTPPAVLDLTPPQTSIDSKPKATVKTKGRSAAYSISFAANEPATFRCSLDGAPFTACTSPATGRAKKGSHTFSVIATDTSGNADPTAAKATWKVKRKRLGD